MFYTSIGLLKVDSLRSRPIVLPFEAIAFPKYAMRYREIVREALSQTLPATAENIAAAKRFVFQKWQERAREFAGRDDPVDLTDACKFTSLFAASVFGGQVRGNFFHQWAELPDGRTLDLNDEAADVIAMLRGEVLDHSRPYADAMGQKLPKQLYTHDRRHMRSLANRQSVASVRPRVKRWAAEFLASRGLTEGESQDDPSVFDVYHASATRFAKFQPYSHFGSLRAAKSVLSIKRMFGQRPDRIFLYHCRIRLAHPLQLSYDEANDEALLYHAVRTGKYDDRYPVLRQWAVDPHARLEDFGFDGIIYPNRLDDHGRQSFIVFNPANVQVIEVQEQTLNALRNRK